MIYSPTAHPEVNESYIHELPKNNGLIFHMGEVSELWSKTVVNNSHVFNLSNCSIVTVFPKCNAVEVELRSCLLVP